MALNKRLSELCTSMRTGCVAPGNMSRWLAEENGEKWLKVECFITWCFCSKLIPGVRHKYGLDIYVIFYLLIPCDEFK
jgi:hypothetical protein